MDDLAPIGHNSGVAPLYDQGAFNALKTRMEALADAGGQWLDMGQIDSTERAQKLVDFTAQVKDQIKAIEDARKRAKAPHMDAAAAVDAAFKALSVPLDTLAGKLGRMMTAFQQVEKARLDAERREREAAARAAAEDARRAAEAAAARNDVIGQAEAEKAAKEAAKAVKEAARPVSAQVSSATGGARTVALRTYHVAGFDAALPVDVARVKAFNALSRRPEARAKLDALVLQLAEAEHRAKDGDKTIAGIEFQQEQRAV